MDAAFIEAINARIDALGDRIEKLETSVDQARETLHSYKGFFLGVVTIASAAAGIAGLVAAFV